MAKPDFWLQAMIGVAVGISTLAYAYKESKG
jgi:hypothetical protein